MKVVKGSQRVSQGVTIGTQGNRVVLCMKVHSMDATRLKARSVIVIYPTRAGRRQLAMRK